MARRRRTFRAPLVLGDARIANRAVFEVQLVDGGPPSMCCRMNSTHSALPERSRVKNKLIRKGACCEISGQGTASDVRLREPPWPRVARRWPSIADTPGRDS